MTNNLFEGGAMPGVGPIHIDEIVPTLDALEKTLGIDLKNNVLGSVGKKEFSGDIDVAIQVDADKIPELVKKIEASQLVLDIAKSSVIMTKVKIVNYDETKQTTKPRTGFVQVDFMPGDPGWMKTYYHSPSEQESKYKGVFRNLLIATICAVHERNASEEKIDDGRPVEVERWMWSPSDGLIRIKRTPVPKKNGLGYTKKNQNVKVREPIKDALGIAKALGFDGPEDLNSYESLKAAMEKNYEQGLVNNILSSFAKNGTVIDIGVPDELLDTPQQAQQETLEDKQLARIKQLSGSLLNSSVMISGAFNR
jgi:hypothetical protein|tara:strand:+ start:1130 stop:2056 length:927 start_codon:yes stop_codon:yes gene_type:complete